MKSWKAMAVLLLLAGGFGADAHAQSAPPVVTVAKPVVRDVVDTDEFIGRFQAVNEVSVRARVGGYLDEVHFVDGALVKKGDLLFTVDQRPFKSALDEATAALDVANSTLQYAEAQYQRAQSLAPGVAQSAATLDDRRREWITAQANVRGAQAAVDRAKLDLDYTAITAPISGRINRHLVSVGNLVQANDTVLTTIVSLDPIDFYFNVDERRMLNFAKTARDRGSDLQQGSSGLPVQVSIIDSTQEPFVGKLDFAENRIDNETGTIQLRARFDNPDYILLPGLFGRASVEASNTYSAILVPDEAIGSDLNQRVVYVVGADGTVSSKPVRPGPRLYGYRVIRDGMTGDETIVVKGLVRVRPGMKVEAKMVTLPPEVEAAPPESVVEESAQ